MPSTRVSRGLGRCWGWALLLLALTGPGWSQSFEPAVYDMGSPTLLDIWVDPVNGNDGRTGASRALALRTLTAAWNRIPRGVALTTGYRLLLTAGAHSQTPGWYDARQGSFAFPVILQAVDGEGTALLPNMDIYDCHYLYLLGLHLRSGGGDVLHLASCRSVLVRDCTIEGQGDIGNYDGPQEGMKVNQTQYLYVENCDISGGWDNAFDCVAVQYGHVIRSKIHRGGDWCMYVKGGSAHLRIEGNEFYDGRTGGFTAGQGTGFEYMVSPWLHYEAEDIKFVNNVVHHTGTVGLGVNGGYNILMAYNTLYKAVTNDHVIEVTQGSRSCDGDTAQCDLNHAAGGWGLSSGGDGQYIPSRNVYIFNNLIYNPPGFGNGWSHFTVPGPVTPPAGSQVPSPSTVDFNLRIQGNLIWNGPVGHPLGIGEAGQGGQPSNPTCHPTLVLAQNTLNQFQPQLIDPENGDFRPVPGGNVFGALTYAIPDFPGNDRPQPPLAPQGNLINTVPRDWTGLTRIQVGPPGAYGVVSLPPPTDSRTRCDYDGDGAADLAVWHGSSGKWYIRTLSGTVLLWNATWGGLGGIPLPGDYDGDGRNDLAVYHRGLWSIRTLSGLELARNVNWGWSGVLPVHGDYDGDRISDLAVFDPLRGRWYIRTLAGSIRLWDFGWGFAGAQAVPGDYDGDGAADLGIFHPAGGSWYVYSPARERVLLWAVRWGWNGARALTGDFDGDAAEDLVMVDPVSAHWYVYSPTTRQVLRWRLQWGFAGVVPGTPDRDGDGKADPTVFAPASGFWYSLLSSDGTGRAIPWGFTGVTPLL